MILIIKPQRDPHALDIRPFSLVRPGGMMVAFRKWAAPARSATVLQFSSFIRLSDRSAARVKRVEPFVSRHRLLPGKDLRTNSLSRCVGFKGNKE